LSSETLYVSRHITSAVQGVSRMWNGGRTKLENLAAVANAVSILRRANALPFRGNGLTDPVNALPFRGKGEPG
jgi:hypothetical protein